jgi:hypothetical protein
MSDVVESVAASPPLHPRQEETFPRLTGAEIGRVSRFGTACRFEDGERLFAAGEPGPGMYIVLAGQVAISQRDGFGRRQPIAEQGPGEFVAEVGQLSGRPALVDAEAEGAVEALAGHLGDRLRSMDVGCRIGEDELAAILPEVEGLDALRVGERLRASLRTVEALTGFTLSVGVASFPSQAGRPDTLVAHARTALGWARDEGGDRTFIFNAETAEILRAEERDRDRDEDAVVTTVAALAASVDARHPSTVGHSENVGRLAALIGAEMGLPLDRCEDLRVAGLVHDVGKIGLDDEIVVPSGPLAPAQEAELRRHPEIGERMIAGSRLAIVGPWILHHHERVDGTGYPAGLAGEAIPLEARILAVANVFDRLCAGGPTRFGLPPADVMDELGRRSGSELDPADEGALRALDGRGAADTPSAARPEEPR